MPAVVLNRLERFLPVPLLMQAQRMLRFGLVGFGGLAVDMAVFHLLAEELMLHALVARMGSMTMATLFTWALNRLFTFGASGRRKREEILRYALVTAGAQGFNYALFALLVTGPLAASPKLALLVGSGAAAFLSYAGHALFSFAPRREAAAMREA